MLGKYQESLLSPGLRFGATVGTAQRGPRPASRFGMSPHYAVGGVEASQYDMNDPFMAPGAKNMPHVPAERKRLRAAPAGGLGCRPCGQIPESELYIGPQPVHPASVRGMCGSRGVSSLQQLYLQMKVTLTTRAESQPVTRRGTVRRMTAPSPARTTTAAACAAGWAGCCAATAARPPVTSRALVRAHQRQAPAHAAVPPDPSRAEIGRVAAQSIEPGVVPWLSMYCGSTVVALRDLWVLWTYPLHKACQTI